VAFHYLIFIFQEKFKDLDPFEGARKVTPQISASKDMNDLDLATSNNLNAVKADLSILPKKPSSKQKEQV
jgi:hypothetical protein